jgi:hypothetical protein
LEVFEWISKFINLESDFDRIGQQWKTEEIERRESDLEEKTK